MVFNDFGNPDFAGDNSGDTIDDGFGAGPLRRNNAVHVLHGRAAMARVQSTGQS